jgi:type IV pilus assembly protein PilN
MIRINLIPTKRKKKAKPLAGYLVSAVFVGIGSMVLAFFVNSYMSSVVEELEKKSAENKKLIAQLDKQIKEVKDFEKVKKRFLDRKKVIEELTANQSLPVRILDELSGRLSEGVWLSNLTIKKNRVSLAGEGFSNNDIVDYVQNMKESELFNNVQLLGTNKSKKGDVETFIFNISFEVKG